MGHADVVDILPISNRSTSVKRSLMTLHAIASSTSSCQPRRGGKLHLHILHVCKFMLKNIGETAVSVPRAGRAIMQSLQEKACSARAFTIQLVLLG